MFLKEQILFSEQECSLIRNLPKENSQEWNNLDRRYRSLAINLSNQTEWVFLRLKTFFEDSTGIKTRKLKEQLHFHRYEKGDSFGLHTDERDKRVYAIGAVLNSDFKGGDFKLYNPEEVTLGKYLGNSYIFDVRIQHQVMPIEEGVRYSILWFLQQEHIKFKIDKLL